MGGVLAWLSDVLASAGVAAGLSAALATYLPLAGDGIGRGLVLGVVIGSIAAINIRGVRQGAAFVEGMTIVKLLPLLLFVVVGASLMTWDRRLLPTWPTVDVLGRTMLVLMFAYSGAESAMSLSGEIERPERTVPRALLMALAGDQPALLERAHGGVWRTGRRAGAVHCRAAGRCRRAAWPDRG